MSDPTPVPLDEIEAAARGAILLANVGATMPDGQPMAVTPPATALALCEALRIAVEACERVAALEATADPVAAVTKDRPDHAFALGMAKAYAKHALAAVRELVDLGGDR